MSRIGPVPSLGFEQPQRLKWPQQESKELGDSIMPQEAGTKCTQHCMITPRIGQREPQQGLPVNATAYRMGGLTIGEVFSTLSQADESSTPWGYGCKPCHD
jgi:hypothetical protein